MLASIVIGNYNYARFLSAAVESALSQTYRDVEVIVVDDGSTDESRSILHRYKDRVRIVLQENGGRAAVFNSGFRVSSGDIVLFLDSDDLLIPHAIEAVAGHPRRNTVQGRESKY
jgi:glycosyltransferase involved in cell wall biosynthesis